MLYLTLGLMKAGKSKNLIQHYHLLKNAGDLLELDGELTVGVFSYKPYEESKFVDVTTRAEGIEPISNVLNLSKIYLKHDLLNVLNSYDVVLIDEIQFAPKEHLPVLVDLSKERDIACYGLVVDYQGHLFESIEELILLGEDDEEIGFVYLEAECEECGEKAKHNIRITDETELFVTNKESYKTVCTKCKEEIES